MKESWLKLCEEYNKIFEETLKELDETRVMPNGLEKWRRQSDALRKVMPAAQVFINLVEGYCDGGSSP